MTIKCKECEQETDTLIYGQCSSCYEAGAHLAFVKRAWKQNLPFILLWLGLGMLIGTFLK